MSRSATKKVSLGAGNEGTSVWHRERDPVSPIKPSGNSTPTQAIVRKRTKSTTNSHGHSRQEEDVNKTASFFSKNRVARRVKTNEDNRGRARREREREHEVEFEIHSASGVSSGDNSPNDRDGVRKVKKVDEEEKWMGMSPFIPFTCRKKRGLMTDILIANGAKRMDRQDAQPPRNLKPPPSVPGGLPPSPRPTYPNLPPANGVGPQHTPELSYDNERSAEDESQSIAPATPRASAFSHTEVSPRSSEDREDPYAHGLARRHQGEGNQAYNYSDEEEARYFTDDPSSAEFTSRSSNETDPRLASGSSHIPPAQREIPIIAPKPTRDTLHNIVDQYAQRDSTVSYAQRSSMVSYDSQYDDSAASINPDSSPSKTVKTQASNDTEEERGGGDQFEELKSPLSPPVPTFDLTPGREPSPMRYRHGEPLQFGRLAYSFL
jgi:hypothetical protein